MPAPPAPPALPDTPSRFGAATWRATAPLLLWALHFAVLYVVVAVGCMRGWGRTQVAGLPLVNVVLLVFSIVVLAVMGLMLRRALRDWRDPARRGLVVPALRVGGGSLALVGTVWDTVPLLMIMPCGLQI